MRPTWRSVFSIVVASSVGVSSSQAETVFFDDFSDGSITNDVPLDRDGNPVVWEPGIDVPGVVDASSGDLTFRWASFDGVGADVPGIQLADTSIRTQINAFEARNMNLLARIGPGGNYYAGITTTGFPYIGAAFAGEPDLTDLGAGDQTDLRFQEEDVILQFDLIGDVLTLRVWRPGESMPAPQVTVIDDQLASGSPGVFFNGSGARPGPGRYRYVHVADSLIPEPTSAVLVLSCLASLSLIRRFEQPKSN